MAAATPARSQPLSLPETTLASGRCVGGETIKTAIFNKRATCTPKSQTLARLAWSPLLSPPRAPRPAPSTPGTHRHGLQGLHNDPVDLVEQPAGHLLASGALQVQPQVVHRPLAPVDVVVILLATEKGVAPQAMLPEEPSACSHP